MSTELMAVMSQEWDYKDWIIFSLGNLSIITLYLFLKCRRQLLEVVDPNNCTQAYNSPWPSNLNDAVRLGSPKWYYNYLIETNAPLERSLRNPNIFICGHCLSTHCKHNRIPNLSEAERKYNCTTCASPGCIHNTSEIRSVRRLTAKYCEIKGMSNRTPWSCS
jgi:hypothetical protein